VERVTRDLERTQQATANIIIQLRFCNIYIFTLGPVLIKIVNCWTFFVFFELRLIQKKKMLSVKWKVPTLVALAVLVQAIFVTALFVPLKSQQAHATNPRNYDSQLYLSSPETTKDTDRNFVFIKGLMGNLSKLCDRYIMNGSPKIREQVVSKKYYLLLLQQLF
jgi:hypothetical protein